MSGVYEDHGLILARKISIYTHTESRQPAMTTDAPASAAYALEVQAYAHAAPTDTPKVQRAVTAAYNALDKLYKRVQTAEKKLDKSTAANLEERARVLQERCAEFEKQAGCRRDALAQLRTSEECPLPASEDASETEGEGATEAAQPASKPRKKAPVVYEVPGPNVFLEPFPGPEALQQCFVDALRDETHPVQDRIPHVKAALISFMNRFCAHITLVNPRVICACYDLVAHQQSALQSLDVQYVTFPATNAGWSQFGDHWGPLTIPRQVFDWGFSQAQYKELQFFTHAPTLLWKNSPKHRRYDQAAFAPPKDFRKPLGEISRAFNLYSGPGLTYEQCCEGAPDPDNEHAKEFIRYLRDLLPAPEDGGNELFDALMYFAAHLMQHPGVKLPLSPVMAGEKGAGKTLFWVVLSSLVGMRYVLTPTSHGALKSEFVNTKNKLIVFADELAFRGDRAGLNILKKLATNTVQSGRDLYERMETYTDVSRLGVTCNEQGLALDEEGVERRWIVINTRGARRDLRHLMTKESLHAIGRLLYEWPLDEAVLDYDRLYKNSTASEEIIAARAAAATLEGFMLQLFESPAIFGTPLHADSLWNRYCKWADHRKVHQNARIGSKAILHRDLRKTWNLIRKKNGAAILPPMDECVAALAAKMGVDADVLASYYSHHDEESDGEAEEAAPPAKAAGGCEQPEPLAADEPGPSPVTMADLDEMIDELM
eukprot:m.282218 g.282218  ORF g.282218 m.282218 type:complete len:714 (+) comp11110_c0_seq13:736-2877(+)